VCVCVCLPAHVVRIMQDPLRGQVDRLWADIGHLVGLCGCVGVCMCVHVCVCVCRDMSPSIL